MIGSMCSQGNKEALESFRRVGEILAAELKPILEELGIECLLFGGQISRSFAYIEPALKPLIDEVSELKHISTMQHLSTAAPLGLLSMLRKSLNL
jgi:glucokinase